MAMAITRMRLERLYEERKRTAEKLEDLLQIAEEEKRDLNESEQAQATKYRERTVSLDGEIGELAGDMEHAGAALDVSQLLRDDPETKRRHAAENPVQSYKTFAQYARDEIITRFPLIESQAGRDPEYKQRALERLQVVRSRAVEHTLSSDVQGLLPPTFMTQIMDIINSSRPVIAAGARRVNLDTGKLTYPVIATRPTVLKQGTEKTEAGTTGMNVDMATLTADTYLGGGNLSWQTINWSTPDALQLWFDLAGEAYARQTETAACSELGTAGGGTITTPLGTAGTEDFATWRSAVLRALGTIYANTGGRAQSNVLYLSAQRFFQLAGLGTNAVLQVSEVGGLDVGAMTGSWSGLRVVGSYGFTNVNTAIVGDQSAFLVGETAGAPIELRAVEPAIGGMEVGVIGAFKAKVFDPLRFIHLS